MRRDQVRALVQSYIDGDDARFRATVSQIAAHESGDFGSRLLDLVGKPRKQDNVVVLSGDAAGLFRSVAPKVSLHDVVLPPDKRSTLEGLLCEQRARMKLLEAGLQAAAKLLLTGPPGTGKTMTAEALAKELDLPLFAVELPSVIDPYLGATNKKLLALFSAVRQVPGVYFFDEFDALGASRGRDEGGAGGEMRRALNVLLQQLDQGVGNSVIVFATNLVEMLDRALFRRFDVVLQYEYPSPPEKFELIATLIPRLVQRPIAQEPLASMPVSQADITHACLTLRKLEVLFGTPPTFEALLKELSRRSGGRA